MKIAVVGGGIIGRLAALRFRRAGATVRLLERETRVSRTGASFAAAGLLAPHAEAAAFAPKEAWLRDLGRDAVRAWSGIVDSLPGRVGIWREGSVVVARRGDLPELEEFRAKVPAAQWLSREELAALEPDLGEVCVAGLAVPEEGCVHSGEAMDALLAALDAEGVTLEFGAAVEDLAQLADADAVIDARGLGARGDLPELRGVRGEMLELEAPEFGLGRPARVLHSRYTVYLVPRGEGRVLVGATAIESEDLRPITVTSTLELLSAVYDLSPALREASVVRTIAQLRPAFFDHAPRIAADGGRVVRVNGLYRHGWLFAPAVTDALVSFVLEGRRNAPQELFRCN